MQAGLPAWQPRSAHVKSARLAALHRVSGYAPPAIADPAFTLRG